METLWISVALVGFVNIVGYLVMLVHIRQQAREMSRLQAHLDVFVDSSINVAASVDKLIHQPQRENDAGAVPSRRWLLAEAQERMANGEELIEVAQPLGLKRDEMRMLAAQYH